jgi:hypothetical protein
MKTNHKYWVLCAIKSNKVKNGTEVYHYQQRDTNRTTHGCTERKQSHAWTPHRPKPTGIWCAAMLVWQSSGRKCLCSLYVIIYIQSMDDKSTIAFNPLASSEKKKIIFLQPMVLEKRKPNDWSRLSTNLSIWPSKNRFRVMKFKTWIIYHSRKVEKARDEISPPQGSTHPAASSLNLDYKKDSLEIWGKRAQLSPWRRGAAVEIGPHRECST